MDCNSLSYCIGNKVVRDCNNRIIEIIEILKANLGLRLDSITAQSTSQIFVVQRAHSIGYPQLQIPHALDELSPVAASFRVSTQRG